ncbi:MAG: helix-hairpin-helix domain-containing protein [Burkholderiaceae bacterium]|jgi:hypothetical protein
MSSPPQTLETALGGAPQRTRHDPLSELRNIGPAMRADLEKLGIQTINELAASNADVLYLRLSEISGQRQDPCVWDVFAAAIHQARSGEARDWWAFTPMRKAREERGEFPHGLQN